MDNLAKYCDRELQEMQEVCVILGKSETEKMLSDISKIALVGINRELDTRKIQAEGRKL